MFFIIHIHRENVSHQTMDEKFPDAYVKVNDVVVLSLEVMKSFTLFTVCLDDTSVCLNTVISAV